MIQMFRWDSEYYDKLQYKDMLEDERQQKLEDEFYGGDYEEDLLEDKE